MKHAALLFSFVASSCAGSIEVDEIHDPIPAPVSRSTIDWDVDLTAALEAARAEAERRQIEGAGVSARSGGRFAARSMGPSGPAGAPSASLEVAAEYEVFADDGELLAELGYVGDGTVASDDGVSAPAPEVRSWRAAGAPTNATTFPRPSGSGAYPFLRQGNGRRLRQGQAFAAASAQ